ncbi:MAG: hypothetical protein ABI743_07120 [bacterium]
MTLPYVRYVIVVHGIGNQRQNETVLPFVNRFAERRHRAPRKDRGDVVTRGRALGQTGLIGKAELNDTTSATDHARIWLEFADIPNNPATTPAVAFVGDEAEDGTNLRFIDLWWADILEADFKAAGQSTDQWATVLLNRLRKRTTTPDLTLKLMEVFAGTTAMTSRLFGFRSPKLQKLIFDDYLGDVQMYGEYPITRGRAVRRFHELLARVELLHDREEWNRISGLLRQQSKGETIDTAGLAYRPARYTIIAHSLGSIMAFDALMLAGAHPSKRFSRLSPTMAGAVPRPCQGWPFVGYAAGDTAAPVGTLGKLAELHLGFWGTPAPERWRELETLQQQVKHYDTRWLDRVDAFVTIGSPIDKFLTLFPENYEYLDRPDDWIDPDRERPAGRKIPHFNYCEEQDPVGDPLDIASAQAAFKRLFVPRDDFIYCGNGIPGWAHLAYFEDPLLIGHVLRHAVDQPTVVPSHPRFGQRITNALYRPWAYLLALFCGYFLWPILIAAGAYAAYESWDFPSSPQAYLTWHRTNWLEQFPAFAIMLALFWYGRRLIELTIWWRLLLKEMTAKAGATNNLSARERVAQTFDFCQRLIRNLLPLTAGVLAGASALIERRLLLDPPLILIALLCLGAFFFSDLGRLDLPAAVRSKRLRKLILTDGYTTGGNGLWLVIGYLLGSALIREPAGRELADNFVGILLVYIVLIPAAMAIGTLNERPNSTRRLTIPTWSGTAAAIAIAVNIIVVLKLVQLPIPAIQQFLAVLFAPVATIGHRTIETATDGVVALLLLAGSNGYSYQLRLYVRDHLGRREVAAPQAPLPPGNLGGTMTSNPPTP